MTQDFSQPLMEHLLELRRRLLWVALAFILCFGLCYAFAEHIFAILIRPLATALEAVGSRRLIYTGMAEAFVTYVKVALFGAAFLSFPMLACQIWLFVKPGLYKREKKFFLPFLIATPFLFSLGAFFAYQFIMPAAWSFFLGFETTPLQTALPIQLEARISEYLSLSMQLLLAFGICFQLPVLLVLLARVGILKAHALTQKRRYAFLGILIVSAILTPPDVLSMLGLACPLYGLFEISIPLMRFVEKRYHPKDVLDVENKSCTI
jgi:sec-independent protein translocase protein TatC